MTTTVVLGLIKSTTDTYPSDISTHGSSSSIEPMINENQKPTDVPDSTFEFRAIAFPISQSAQPTEISDSTTFLDIRIDGKAKLGTYLDANGKVRENNTLSSNFFLRDVLGDSRFVMVNGGEGPSITFIDINGSVAETTDGSYSFTIYGLDDFWDSNEYIQLYITGSLGKDKKTISSLHGILAYDRGTSISRCDIRINSFCYPEYTDSNSFEQDEWQLTFEITKGDSLNDDEKLNHFYGATMGTRLLVSTFRIAHEGVAELFESDEDFREGPHDVKIQLSGTYFVSADGQLELRPNVELQLVSKNPTDNYGREYEVYIDKIEVSNDSIIFSANIIGEEEEEGGFVKGTIVFPSRIDFENPTGEQMISKTGTNALKAEIRTESGMILVFDTENTSSGSIELSKL